FLGLIDPARQALVQTVANSFVTTAEARSELIRRLFSSADPQAIGTYLLPIGNLLQRLATTNEVNTYLGVLQSGNTVETVISILMGSAEYFGTRAGNNATNWLNQAYLDLLGRARD